MLIGVTGLIASHPFDTIRVRLDSNYLHRAVASGEHLKFQRGHIGTSQLNSMYRAKEYDRFGTI